MDFAAYASRAFALPRLNLEADALRKLGRLLDRETSLGEISKGYAAELGGTFPDDYVVAREIWHDYLAWRQVVKDVSTRRMDAGRYLLPEDTIRTTWSPEGIRLLEEVDASFSPDTSRSHAIWHQTLADVAAAWQANLRRTFEQGGVRARSTSGAGGISEHRFAEISCTAWLRLTNAEEDGRCQLEFELPALDLSALADAIEAGGTGDNDGTEEKLSRLQDIMEDHIEDGMRNLMMRRSVIRAFLEADATYRGRLELRPLAGDQARAVYLAATGDEAMGLAVVRRDGHVVETTVVDPDTSADEILAWMATQAADDDPVVVPEGTEQLEILEMLSSAIPEHARMQYVPSDGLPGPEDGLSGEALTQAAIELGRRAFKPRRTWLECPVSSMELLGRGVRLPDADAGKLNRHLQEIRDQVAGVSTRKRGKSPREAAPQPRSPQAPESRKKQGKRGKVTNRNPQVNKIADLEPGMELQGKVTNLNRFGAFVDVGIPKEGLIPMHSLTDGFSDNPTSVVRPGYEVLVTVVSVNPARRRFDLRLEQIIAKSKNTGKRGRSRGGRKGGRRSQGGKQKSSSGGSQSGGQSANGRA